MTFFALTSGSGSINFNGFGPALLTFSLASSTLFTNLSASAPLNQYWFIL
jgi:hypothetical protein